MKNYKLHLIRHGMTEGNKLGLYLGGGTDSSLSPEGIEKLYMLKEKFEYPKAEKIYVSPMKRTLETTEILFGEQEYSITADLKECNFGEFEGKTFQELMSGNPNFAKWLDHTTGYTPEGGESSGEFAQRCVNALDEILMDMMKNGIFEAVAVCHGGVIGLMLTIMGYPKKPMHEWNSDNGCGFTIQTNPRMWTRDEAVEVINILPYGYDDSENHTNKFRDNK